MPRTRVYDAIRILESQGLVEVQHSNPQQFRAVDIDEAVRTLRRKFDDRIDTLESSLETIEQQETNGGKEPVQEVWSLTGNDAIEPRTLELIDEATSEIALLVVDEALLSDALYDGLHDGAERDLSIVLGGQTEGIATELGEELPRVHVSESDLTFLTGPSQDHEVAISRILLIDRETLLIGSYYPDPATTDDPTEQAIVARGLENGVVVLLRRLLSSGLAETAEIES